MDINKEIQELQGYEQNLQSLMMQKQAFQIELSETENALKEISKSKEDVFKVIGNIMIKTNKDNIEDELKKKQKILSIRLKSIEKQESEFSKQIDKLRDEVMKKIK